jgi:hypothetical protein
LIIRTNQRDIIARRRYEFASFDDDGNDDTRDNDDGDITRDDDDDNDELDGILYVV